MAVYPAGGGQNGTLADIGGYCCSSSWNFYNYYFNMSVVTAETLTAVFVAVSILLLPLDSSQYNFVLIHVDSNFKIGLNF